MTDEKTYFEETFDGVSEAEWPLPNSTGRDPILYDRGPTHCPCGERKCPDTLDGEQAHFTTYTSVDGVRIHEGRLRDPLITSVTVVSWFDLLKALFKGSLTLRVEVRACREMTGAVVRLGRMTETAVVETVTALDDPRSGL